MKQGLAALMLLLLLHKREPSTRPLETRSGLLIGYNRE